MSEAERIKKAVDLAIGYGQIDGGHHKMWGIDQMLRVLLGDAYDQTIEDLCKGDYGPHTYSWGTGIEP